LAIAAVVMTIEIKMLTMSVVLGFVHLILSAVATTAHYGPKWNMGSRDEEMPRLAGIAGRLNRAFANFRETFPLFAALVLIVEVTDRHSVLTAWGCQLYFWARLVYLPIYAAGVPVLRTLVWSIAALGIAMVLLTLW
jgi:uncharacterized MAPEG superfamily protein